MTTAFFDDFWEASSFNEFTIQDFAARQQQYNQDQKQLTLEYANIGSKLPSKKTRLTKITSKRTSKRSFGKKPLSLRAIGGLLGSFKTIDGLEHRTYPSAGATYTTEVFLVTFNVVTAFNMQVFYYNAQQHALSFIGPAPTWQQAEDKVNVTVSGTPQALIIFASFTNRATEKYGERGGRFALLEAGAALQQLSLTISDSKQLRGVAVGGLYDKYWLQILKLNPDAAKISVGYLVGN